jgi:Fe-S-cluster-containing hydrogenase component 2
MTNEMTRKEELRELRTKARAIQARLDLLDMLIGQIRQGTPATFKWKAFVDAEKCAGCGICKEVCPVGAIVVEDIARVDVQRCIGCDRCAQACPKEALSLRASGLPGQYRAISWRRGNRGKIPMFR